MKTLLPLFLLVLSLTAFAQVPPPPRATQAEVNAGANVPKYVSPDRLAAYTGLGGSGTGTNNWVATMASLALNTSLTNSTTNAIIVEATVGLQTLLSTDVAKVVAMVETNAGSGAFVIKDIAMFGGIAASNQNTLVYAVPPNCRHYLTNLSAGTSIATIVTNWIDRLITVGPAGATGATGATGPVSWTDFNPNSFNTNSPITVIGGSNNAGGITFTPNNANNSSIYVYNKNLQGLSAIDMLNTNGGVTFGAPNTTIVPTSIYTNRAWIETFDGRLEGFDPLDFFFRMFSTAWSQGYPWMYHAGNTNSLLSLWTGETRIYGFSPGNYDDFGTNNIAMTFAPNGSIGVGVPAQSITTGLGKLLEIYSTNNQPGLIINRASQRKWGVLIGNGQNNAIQFFNITANSVPFFVDGVAPDNTLVLSTNGFVGLSTTAPTNTLHVAGSETVTGDIYLGGQLYSTLFTNAYTTLTNMAISFTNMDQIMNLTSDINFQQTTNRTTAPRSASVVVTLYAGNTNRLLYWNSSWRPIGTSFPQTLASNKYLVVTLKCIGASETNVFVTVGQEQ